MKLGTVAYNDKIYNLDYMDSDEIKKLLENIELDKSQNLNTQKYEIKN